MHIVCKIAFVFSTAAAILACGLDGALGSGVTTMRAYRGGTPSLTALDALVQSIRVSP